MKTSTTLLILFTFLTTGISQVQLGQDIDGEAAYDYFGTSSMISGDGSTIIIGGPENDLNGAPGMSLAGHAQVFALSAGNIWVQKGADIDGVSANDAFGRAVAISDDGNIVVVSAPFGGMSSQGFTKVYSYSTGLWTQLGQTIFGNPSFDYSGSAVSLSDDGLTLAIGATTLSSTNGYVIVYSYDIGSSQWIQKGSTIIGEAAGDESGNALSLSGDGNTIAIAARNNDGTGTDAGHVRLYQFGTNWTQIGADIDGEAMDDHSGWAVSLSDLGDRVIIGARENIANGGGAWFGQARIYQLTAGSWSQIGQDLDGEASADFLGQAVAISGDGNTISVGAFQNDGNGSSSGHTRVFQFDGSLWIQIGMDIDGEAAADFSGSSVSLSDDGTRVAIGAPNNDNANGTDSGHTRVYSTGVSSCTSDYASTNQLTGSVSGPLDYETDGAIESIQTINGSATVDYDSDTEITLLPGFCTISTVTFHAFIDGCGGAQ